MMNIIRRLKKAIKNPKETAWLLIIRINNIFISMKTHKGSVSSDLKELNEIKKHSSVLTDMRDHLETLFIESLTLKPKLIVELGVRTGESTFVLERVANLCSSKLVSVDIENCSHISSYKEWLFVQKDDIEFAKEFETWCKINGIEPKIDILFIDTSHLFDHTLQEIKSWFPFLSNQSRVFFHDTNLKRVYHRKDGSMGYTYGFYNERGVIRALNKYFNKSFDEKEDFVDFRNGWLIKHNSQCSGFTMLEKYPPLATDIPVSS